MTTTNYFSRTTISSASFPAVSAPSISFGFQASSFSLINEGTGTISYSFDGTTVHGDLVAGTPSAAMVFKDRGANMIWLKLSSGAASSCRVEAADGLIEISAVGGAVTVSSVTVSPSTPASSSALEASHVLKASAGTFRSLYVMLDASAPSATYYVQLMTASATVPANGAVTFLRPPQTIVHTMGAPDGVNFDEGDSGITFTVGCTACISSTQFTKTLSGSYAFFSGSVL